MHFKLFSQFSRKVKSVLLEKLPQNLKSISLLKHEDSEIVTQQFATQKSTEIKPKIEPISLKINANHPQKYLVKTANFTNSEAKKLIENDLIYSKGNPNLPDTSQLPYTEMSLRNNQTTREILVENKKLYLFYKPTGLICSETDQTDRKRFTIFWYLQNYHHITEQLYLCVN